MQIDFWPEDHNNPIFTDLYNLLGNKKDIGKYLDKLKTYEKYPIHKLFSSEKIKRIQNWPLHEIRIKQIRFLGDIFDDIFWIFTVEKKKGNKLPKSAFERADNIRNNFLESINEN